jgi:hypothetical protein
MGHTKSRCSAVVEFIQPNPIDVLASSNCQCMELICRRRSVHVDYMICSFRICLTASDSQNVPLLLRIIDLINDNLLKFKKTTCSIRRPSIGRLELDKVLDNLYA